jgi:hypothetical protein
VNNMESMCLFFPNILYGFNVFHLSKTIIKVCDM